MRIIKEETAAVVIDYQSKLFPHIYNHEKLEAAAIKLITGLKLIGMPIIVTEQYPKGIGYTIDSIKNVLSDSYKPLEKSTFSCYDDKNFKKQVDSLGRKNILICGIEAHVCVLQTVIDLQENDYQTIVVDNAIGSRNPHDSKIARKRMIAAGALFTTYESILFELLRDSKAPQFRDISKLIK